MTTASMKFTLAHRADGGPVGKTARAVGGKIVRDTEGKQHPDEFRVVEVAPGQELGHWVNDLASSQLVVAGVPKEGATTGQIVLKRDPRGGGRVALSDDDFEWPEGPGLLLLDYDPKSADEGWIEDLAIEIEDYAKVLAAVVPGLTRSFTRWPSSSSCIAGDGVEPRGVVGYHHAIPVADASDIPRAGSVLHKRLVLEGLGFAFITKAGTALVRSIVDTAIWRPSHPLFLGGVSCAPGLKQDRTPFIDWATDAGPVVDTLSLLPDLNDEEEEAFEAECRRLIDGARERIEKRKVAYAEEQTQRRAARIAKDRGLSLEEAVAEARAGINKELAAGRVGADGRREARLTRDAETVTDRGIVTVAEILGSPERWHGVDCADPQEPEYGKGVGSARIYTQGTPLINSFAHGGCVYWLDRPDAAEEFAEFDDADEIPEHEEQCETPERKEAGLAGREEDSCERDGAASDSGGDDPPPVSRMPTGAAGVRDAASLMSQEFAPVQWAISGIMPRGCWVLAGKPKTGKSWFALDLLLATAAGRLFLGGATEEGEVLYLALEDNDRRMRDRLAQLGAAGMPIACLKRLHFHTSWPGDDDCFKHLKAFLREHPGVRMVVVDTLAKVKKAAGRTGTAYDSDYGALGPFQSIASRFGVTIVLVTHLRKSETADSFDDISGSAAILGAVDGAMILSRGASKGRLALKVRGRDLDEDLEIDIERDAAGHFKMVGPTEAVRHNEERQRIVDYLVAEGDDGASVRELHNALDRRDLRNTRRLLQRMTDDWLIFARGGRFYASDDDDGPLPVPPVSAAGAGAVQ